MEKTQSKAYLPLLLIVALIALAWAMVGQSVISQISKASPSRHALESHAEAASIIDCINKNGPAAQFRDKFDGNKFYLTCQLPDGRWGLAPFAKQAGKLWNKTAFVPKSGTWQELCDYLNGIATKYNGTLPPFGQ